MATKKKMLQAAAGNAGGGAVLNVEDVFSTYLYEGNGSSQVIENGINLGQSNSGGGADFSGADTVNMIVPGSSDFGYGTGDYTIEFFVFKYSDKNYITYYDQRTSTQNATTNTPFLYSDSGGTLYFHIANANRITGSGTNIATGAWTHVALCRSSGSTKLFVNGTQIGSTYSDSNNYVTPASNWSVGGSLEQSLYNVEGYMSNVRVVKGSALYTSNFTTPTSALTAVSGTVLLALQGDDPFTDNSSSSHSLTNNGAKAATFGPFDADDAGEGGLVWVKSRDLTYDNYIMDTERGVLKYLKANGPSAQASSSNAISAFNANGFTVGGGGQLNNSGDSLASWTFRKAPKFFTCLTYSGTGPGSGANEQQVSHDLGAKPGIVIIKRTDTTGDWWVFTDVIDGSNDYGYLNGTNAFGDSANNVATDSVFNVGGSLNTSGATYVAYLFASNDGDGEFGPDGDADIIKCGIFTGVGSGAVDVDLGFEPQLVLTKNTSRSADWMIQDVMRGMGLNSWNPIIANKSEAELSTTINRVVPSATGFTINNDGGNDMGQSGDTVIYMAIRRGTKVPESATEVFAIDQQNSSAPYYTSNFPVDMGFLRRKDNTSSWYIYDRLRQGKELVIDTTAAEGGAGSAQFDYMDGFISGAFASDVYSWMWKRAPGYFDAVAYTGDGVAGRTVSHNLGVAPEMMWVKQRDNARNWAIYHSSIGNTGGLLFTTTATQTTPYFWNDTSPQDSLFTLGLGNETNKSAGSFIAYLFASLDGVSKVGSFTATGSVLDIDCGFTSGARFVLIKRTDSTGDWFVFDSVRGITASTSPYLYLNSTSSESVANYIDPLSSGFRVTTNFYGSGDFIFYAIA